MLAFALAVLGLFYTPLAAAEKASRDAGEGLSHLLETDNFALRWGSYERFDDDDVSAIGDALEQTWSVVVDQGGYPAPVRTDLWRFNVFIGDTGPGSPSTYGAEGYFWFDAEGWPMLVLAPPVVADLERGELTATHELFHAVQDAAGAYDLAGPGAWWLEASAVWCEGAVHPDNPRHARDLYGYAFRPEVALDQFVHPSEGGFEALHAYGAFVFVRYLEERHGGWDTVRDVLLTAEGGDDADALVTTARVLGERDTTLEQAWFDFVVRNATWDYARGDLYETWIADRGGWDSDLSHRPSGTLFADAAPVSPPFPPGPWAASYWTLRSPPDALSIEISGAPEGSRAALVLEDAGALRVIPDDDGIVTADDVGWPDQAWLVIATTSHGGDYSVRVVARAPDDDDTDDTGVVERGTCACSTGSPGLGLAIALLPIAALRRRRWVSEPRYLPPSHQGF